MWAEQVKLDKALGRGDTEAAPSPAPPLAMQRASTDRRHCSSWR
jgi:hypothetical protein